MLIFLQAQSKRIKSSAHGLGKLTRRSKKPILNDKEKHRFSSLSIEQKKYNSKNINRKTEIDTQRKFPKKKHNGLAVER